MTTSQFILFAILSFWLPSTVLPLNENSNIKTSSAETTNKSKVIDHHGKANNHSKLEHSLSIGELIHNVVPNTSHNKDSSTPLPKLEHFAGEIVWTGVNAHEFVISQASNATNESCIPPAMQQFPRPIMSLKTRQHGGLILHVIVATYMFIGLAVVCDEYFVASLDRICEELNMSSDVAGATFMAAGSSAPELATVVIGVFLAKDDIGISGVIGSAVFNIMFVISICALATSSVVYLNWWPLLRDCTFYSLSILIMLLVIYDDEISWLGSTVMLLTYALYCIVLRFNSALEQWANTLNVPFKVPQPVNENSGLVTYKNLEEDVGKIQTPGNTSQFNENTNSQGFADNGHNVDNTTRVQRDSVMTNTYVQNYYKPKEFDPATHIDPLSKPTDGGKFAQVKWILLYPIHWLCIHSMPNCRMEKYRNLYPLTFFVSMVWISFYSYFMVWMITVIGFTLGIPDTVMGLTFIAAGVSVPDALSSIAVIREGYGDMAVSNAIGSNVFDILVCLGIPWFMQTAIIHPGSSIKVISKGIIYSTLLLLSTVVFLILVIHYNGWKLDRRFGVFLMAWYLIFITIASLYELNVFGKWNKAECPLNW